MILLQTTITGPEADTKKEIFTMDKTHVPKIQVVN